MVSSASKTNRHLPRPEQHKFFFETLGYAISQWQDVESALFEVFCVVTSCRHRNVASSVFYSTQHFETQLKMTDAAIQVALKSTTLRDRWILLHARCKRRQKVRNKLVHFPVVRDARQKSKHNIYLSTSPHNVLPSLKSKKFPAITSPEIRAMGVSFNQLAFELNDYAQKLSEP